jgi:molybdate transport repressor ModE-like protein
MLCRTLLDEGRKRGRCRGYMLDLRRLKVLREVALQGSFSAAATELMFSASAVSQQIAQLEREVGATLVERRSTGVVLTAAGDLLLAHANAILARAADAEEELRQLSDGHLGRMRISAFSSAAAAMMPQAIVEFRAAQPRVEIELIEQDTRESLDLLQRGELDLAIMVRGAEPDPEGVVVTPLLDDHIDVLLPSHHRLADLPAVSLRELAEEPWADCSGQPVRHHMAALGIEPNVVFRSDHHRVVEGIVAAGVAIALVPRMAQPVTRNDVVVKQIAPDPPVRRVGIAVRDGDHHPFAVHTMIGILQRVSASDAGAGGFELEEALGAR